MNDVLPSYMLRLLVLLVLIASSCSNHISSSPESSDSTVFYLDNDDPGVIKAQEEAQLSLPAFIEAFHKSGRDTSYWFIIKKKFESDEQVEHMWISPRSFANDKFTGVLLDSPVVVKNISRGDSVVVSREEIEDWIFYDNSGIKHGSFTEKFVK